MPIFKNISIKIPSLINRGGIKSSIATIANKTRKFGSYWTLGKTCWPSGHPWCPPVRGDVQPRSFFDIGISFSANKIQLNTVSLRYLLLNYRLLSCTASWHFCLAVASGRRSGKIIFIEVFVHSSSHGPLFLSIDFISYDSRHNIIYYSRFFLFCQHNIIDTFSFLHISGSPWGAPPTQFICKIILFMLRYLC